MEGLEPLKMWWADVANEILEREFDSSLEWSWIEESSVDPQVEAEIVSTLVSNGLLSINQGRARLGEERDSDPAADRLMLKTATGFVPIAQGEIANEVDDEGDTIKLAKGAIVMVHDSAAPPKKFTAGGRTFVPNSNGELILPSDEDVTALLALGWTRKTTRRKR
jgi:hypothetical protein